MQAQSSYVLQAEKKHNRLNNYLAIRLSVADPGFPCGGANRVGEQFPMSYISKKNICQNIRIGMLGGGTPASCAPLDPSV